MPRVCSWHLFGFIFSCPERTLIVTINTPLIVTLNTPLSSPWTHPLSSPWTHPYRHPEHTLIVTLNLFQGLFYMRCWNKFSMTNVARLIAKLSQLDRPNRLPCCPCHETALLSTCKAYLPCLVPAKRCPCQETALFVAFLALLLCLVSSSSSCRTCFGIFSITYWYIKHYRLSIGDNNQYKKHTQTLLSPAFFFCITIHKNFCMIFTQQKTSLSGR